MEPKFQTSFIPKNSVSTSSLPDKPKSVYISILPLLGNILIVLSLLGYGALFGYEHILNSQIADDDKALVFAKQSFDPASSGQLIVASDQIKGAKNLLNKHIAVSNIFALLETNVLSDIKFNTFNFDGTNNLINISVTGEASSYSSLAEQSSLFSKIDYMSNQSFSDFKLTDKGTIQMKFQADINPNLISYTQAVNKVSSPTNPTGN